MEEDLKGSERTAKMSLLSNAMEACVFMEKRRKPDGEGGYTTEWYEGAEFEAAITLDSSIQAQIAQAQGVKGVYTVTVKKQVRLDYHDVFKRLSDGETFRVSSKDDSATPDSAGLNARTVRAEEWEIAT